MIQETLKDIADTYLSATKEPFKENAIAEYLRNDAAQAIAESLGGSYYLCKGSPGQGQWADVPWIGVFDPTVTTSATRGYYVVYLFAADMQRVHLCLAQGTTAVREEFGRNTHDALRRCAGLMQDRIPESKARFSTSDVELFGTSILAKDYEPSIALSVSYDLAALPPEEKLQEDLREIVRLYSILIARGGRDAFEDTVTEEAAETEGATIVERRRYRQHRKLERNSKAGKLAKLAHGYVCQCCGFDFKAIFGDVGKEYIEAHHLMPLSKLPEDVPVPQDPKKDFAVLCANCHRMIHRKDAPKNVDELSALPGVSRLKAALWKIWMT